MARHPAPLPCRLERSCGTGGGVADRSDPTQGTHVTNEMADHGDTQRADTLARAAITRNTFAALVTAARVLLAQQPSEQSVRACARHLAATITQVAEDVIEGRG